jgi:hypothetical protein
MRKPIVLALLAEFRTLFKNLYRQGALGPICEITFLVQFANNIVNIKRDRMVIRRLFTIHIRNQFSNNSTQRQKDKNVSSFSQPKNLQFNPEKIDQVGAEFNGRMTQRYQYTVTESKSGSD